MLSPVFQLSQHGWRVFEATLSEKYSHLDIRIDARLNFPEQFQNEAIAVNDGRVALLRSRKKTVELQIDSATCPSEMRRYVMLSGRPARLGTWHCRRSRSAAKRGILC